MDNISKPNLIFLYLSLIFSFLGIIINTFSINLPTLIILGWGYLGVLLFFWSVLVLLTNHLRKIKFLYNIVPIGIIFIQISLIFHFISGQISTITYTNIVTSILLFFILIFSFYLLFKKARQIKILIAILILIIIGISGYYFYSKPYTIYSNGSIALNKDISISECKTTTDDILLYACTFKYSIEKKDPSFCELLSKHSGKTEDVIMMKNWCYANYIDNYKDSEETVCKKITPNTNDYYYENYSCVDKTKTVEQSMQRASTSTLVYLKVNGSHDVSNIKKDSQINVTWSTNPNYPWVECQAFGIGLSKVDGTGSWNDNNNHTLPPNGSMLLNADFVPISLGIDCYNNKEKSTGGRDYVGPLLQ